MQEEQGIHVRSLALGIEDQLTDFDADRRKITLKNRNVTVVDFQYEWEFYNPQSKRWAKCFKR